MGQVIVGIADCAISADPEAVLVTYALGSCIAVAVHDPVSRVAGLLHYMLPESAIDGEKARERPYMFADTGIARLIGQACEQGAQKRRMRVRIAGGAQVMDDRGVFDIGRRNYLAARKILWRAGVLIDAESVGGTNSRTVRLEVASGAMWVRGPEGGERELGPASPLAVAGTKVNRWVSVY
jgi:chemotaxis protein CheD